MRYLVIGASGHGQEVAWSLREEMRAIGADGECEIAFLDDAIPAGDLPSGLGPVIGGVGLAAQEAAHADTRLVMGVGLPRTKAAMVRRLRVPDHVWATVVHPSAIVGPNVSIGAGSYVAPGAVLTVNVRLGRFVTVNTHCLVAHGGALADFATLHPDAHLSGEVTIAEGCEVGAGAVVLPGLAVGDWAVIGAGAVAVKRLRGGRTYVGVPARALEARAYGAGTAAAQATPPSPAVARRARSLAETNPLTRLLR
jgi:acetyltransferase EpsM